MDYSLPSHLENGLTITHVAPPYAEKFMLPYADAVLKEGSFGWLLSQNVAGNQFSFGQYVFNAIEPIQLTISIKDPCTTFIYVTEGKASYKLNGLKDVVAEARYYYILYVPSGSHSLQLEKGNFTFVQIELSPLLLRKLSHSYYAMYEGEKSIEENNPNAYLLDSRWMRPGICDSLTRMLHCNRNEEERALDQEARVLDLLLLYTEDNGQIEKEPQTRFRFTSEDDNVIVEAGNLKKEKIDLTLKELAREINMHPKKLEVGFKEVFGKSFREYTIDVKMEKAKIFLKETSKPITDIAYELDYSDVSTFIRAFKRSFGITPLAYRQ